MVGQHAAQTVFIPHFSEGLAKEATDDPPELIAGMRVVLAGSERGRRGEAP